MQTHICTKCGTRGALGYQGSATYELAAWLILPTAGLLFTMFGFVVGLLLAASYSFKRRWPTGCGACGGLDLVPLATPRGEQLAREFVEDVLASALEIVADDGALPEADELAEGLRDGFVNPKPKLTAGDYVTFALLGLLVLSVVGSVVWAVMQ